jgi:glycosyltransferase involved in cell wall biosynthesis
MTAPPVPVTFVSSAAEIGGAELYMESLIEALGGDWVGTVIVPEEGELAEGLRRAGHPVEVVRFGRRLGLLAAAARLRRVLRKRPVPVLHANGSRAALVCALAAGRRERVVWLRVDRTLDGPGATLVARRCARTVAISHNVLEGLGERARRSAEVVYPGVPDYDVDRAAGRSLVASLLGCGPDEEVIVLSGRLAPAKGQRELIAAAPALLERRPRTRIALLGGPRAAYPDHEAELRGLARSLGVSERVHFLGHRPPGIDSPAAAVRFVSGCDLLVAPSLRQSPYGWQEGFGLAVAEAMHVGTPVVAYHHGSLPEVLGGCGVVVPEGDSSALAEAIGDLLGDERRRQRMASCAAERARTEFRRADAVVAMRRVYESVATRSGAAAVIR